MNTILRITPLLCLLSALCLVLSGCCCSAVFDDGGESVEASAGSDEEEGDDEEGDDEVAEEGDDDEIDEELEEEAFGDTKVDTMGDEEEEPGPMGPCPEGSGACEDGYDCTCSLNSDDQVVKMEARKRKTGELKVVTTHFYNDKGFKIRTEDDGGIWNKKAKVDGEPDQIWAFTYDENDDRVTQETWTKGARKNLLCNHNGNCPAPHDTDKCYSGRYKCKNIPARALIP